MSRPAFFGLALLTFASVGLAGCQYGNGAPCEIHPDCASGVCCGFTSTQRGYCVANAAACTTVPRTDTGTPDVPDVPVVGEDAPEPIDTGVDAPMDSGVDAPEDTGMDAGDDAGTSDVGDAGLDVPA